MTKTSFVFLVLFLLTCPWIPDCSDSAGGGGGLLSLLAAPSCGSPVGGVWELPTQPGVVCVTGGRSLPGVQQLLRQPSYLRLPV